jgi:hypothetical protein
MRILLSSALIFVFGGVSWADNAADTATVIAKLAKRDPKLARFISGQLDSTEFIQCQGMDYPVQYQLEYGGAVGSLKLSAARDFSTRTEKVALTLDLKQSLLLDIFIVFKESTPTVSNPFIVNFELEDHVNGFGENSGISPQSSRESGMVGTSANGDFFHSFHSVCGFYRLELS